MGVLKRSWSWRASLALVAALPLLGCVDSSDRCGKDRELDATGVCVCKAGTTDQGGTCVATPPAESGLGKACDDSTPCMDPDFPDCHAAAGEPGFCTKNDCTSNAECGQDFRCAVEETPPYCHPPATGQGTPCESDDDCKDFEATFCSVGNPAGVVCLVRDCVDDTSCSSGYTCVDLGTFVPGLPRACVPAM